jgi:hypothetical protein
MNMIVLDCGNCGKTLRIPPEYAGQSGRCKGCGNVIQVPPIPAEIEEDWTISSIAPPVEPTLPIVDEVAQSNPDPILSPATIHRSPPDSAYSRGGGKKFLLGLIGSIALCIGVFAPLVSMPIVGAQNYFANGQGDGTMVLGLAIISLLLVFTKRYRGLWLTGLGSLAMILFTFISFQNVVSDMKSEMRADLEGNPFAGMAEAMIGTVQIQWGWAVLIVGAVLLIASAALVEEE